jgi:hypothetical protein
VGRFGFSRLVHANVTCVPSVTVSIVALAHRFAPAGSILLLHNLADTTVTVDIGPQPGMNGNPYDLYVDGPYAAPTKK